MSYKQKVKDYGHIVGGFVINWRLIIPQHVFKIQDSRFIYSVT